MTAREPATAIEEAALAWAVRFPLDEEEERALEGWLAGDRRRRGALMRALAAWSMLDRARAAQTQPGAEPAIEDEEPNTDTPAPRRGIQRLILHRRTLVGAIGTGIAATVAGLAWLPRHGALNERTGLGEIRRLPLADGSLATINTNSALSIALGQSERRIDLVQGEAWFDVVKDPARPFIVGAGPVRARAIGTSFSVRRAGSAALVSVTEGTVWAWSEDGEAGGVALHAGDQARIGRDGLIGPVQASSARIRRALAWRDGQIMLEGDTLDQAVAEYNRYNGRKLSVVDTDLGQRRLVGLFDTNDPEGFADTVAVMLDVRVVHDGDQIILSRKPMD